MIDLQTAVETPMTLILSGGADAAKDLFKGMVVQGAKDASDTWRDLFGQAPETYPLADRVARDPDAPALAGELRALLEQVLREHPQLLPASGFAVQTGAVQADHGSVAAAVIQGSKIDIDNRR